MSLRYASNEPFKKQINFTFNSVPCRIDYFSKFFMLNGIFQPNVRYEGIAFNGIHVTNPTIAGQVQEILKALIAARQEQLVHPTVFYEDEVVVALHREIVDLQVAEAMAECATVVGDFEYINGPDDYPDQIVPEAINLATGRLPRENS